MEAPGIEMDEMLELDIDFHVAISRATHNSVLELAMNAIHIVRPYTNTMLVPLLSIEKIARQHRAIFQAIDARDEELARATFDIHVAHLEEVRQRALADRRAEEVPVSELTHEAHPAVERIRARILGRPPRP
jgi:GntR family transcriptional regulator, transcriptional repressor for pyruvate dehydrogenase complex